VDAGIDAGIDAGVDAGVTTYTRSFGGTMLAPGAEQTLCVTLRLNNATAFHAGALRAQLTGGWVELLVYQVADTVESATPTACSPFAGLNDATARPILFGRKPDETVTLPAGTGVSFAANQMLRFELHGLNETSNPATFDATLTVTPTTAATPTSSSLLLGFLVDIAVPIGQTASTSGTVRWPADVLGGQALNFTGFTRHFGNGFTAALGPAVVYAPAPYLWDAPELTTPATSPAITDAGVNITCQWRNTSGQMVTFGQGANDEICILRTWVAPSSSTHACVHTANLGGLDVCCPGNAVCSQLF
jgi:hypothetical protein